MVMSQKVQHKLNYAQVTMQYPYGQLYVYIYRVVQLILTPSHWNLIGYSTTVPLPVLFPIKFFCHLHLIVFPLPEWKIWHLFQKFYFFDYYFISLKLCKSGNVCVDLKDFCLVGYSVWTSTAGNLVKSFA